MLDPPLLEPPAPELDPPAEDEKPILLSCERPQKFKKVENFDFPYRPAPLSRKKKIPLMKKETC